MEHGEDDQTLVSLLGEFREERDSTAHDDDHGLKDEREPQANEPSDVIKIFSIGMNSLLLGVHLIGNGMILSSLGPDEEAAASLISGIQAVANGTMFGVLLNTGILLSPQMAKRDYVEMGNIIKTSWVLGLGLSSVAAGALLSMRLFLPQVINANTAYVVNDYFLTYAPGAYFDIIIGSNGMVINLLENNWKFPLLLTALYRVPAVGLSYVFANNLGLRSMGVGLGGTVAGLGAYLLGQTWFLRSFYRRFRLYKLELPNLLKRCRTFIVDGGWKLALLIDSEWGDTTAIATWIDTISNKATIALEPAIQMNTLVALSLQGMGHATMVFWGRDNAKKQQHLVNFEQTKDPAELAHYQRLQAKNKHSFLLYNSMSLALATGLSTAVYLARKPVKQLFIPNATSFESNLADDFILYGGFALAADAIRIMSAGMLRGWNDILYPTLISILFMIVIGVPAGGLLTELAFDDNPLAFFWVRIPAILIAFGVISARFIHHNSCDTERYNEGLRLLAQVSSDVDEQPNEAIDTIYAPSPVGDFLSCSVLNSEEDVSELAAALVVEEQDDCDIETGKLI